MNFMLTFFERSSTFVKSFSNKSASLSELIVLKIMWGRHEFINDRNGDVGKLLLRRFCSSGPLKAIAPRIPNPGISGHGGELESARSLTTTPHGMSSVQKFSSTSVVALTFRHNDICSKILILR